ncbi:hypothetical protein SAMN00768000_1171 [Sulfobacillus thermosulfidooxidans DSM 9293]|uniref:Uncharacterized protein n=2 Tax=Sulfobacillus thermosulfidooxidans TaxID=28034 RepID=A0A1W1WBE9_SULTA|nr:hypothetical protein SAMN00768000_1171 [Sulfobacillus thermosulfidooxidans DSM 9293]
MKIYADKTCCGIECCGNPIGFNGSHRFKFCSVRTRFYSRWVSYGSEDDYRIPTAAATIKAGDITISIPAGTFSQPVNFSLLEGPVSKIAMNEPAGMQTFADFAFKVTETSNNTLVTTFNKPVIFSITNPAVNADTEYYDISPSGQYALNPIPATISGTTLSHAIKADTVAWAVADPTVPDFTQHGFPNVIAKTTFTPGQATSVSANGITVDIPANTFSTPVTFELLQGPIANFTANAPSSQAPVTDFAFKVINNQTGALVGKFNAAVIAKITNSQINSASKYWDITPSGTYQANPIAPTITGDTLSHPIDAAAVGWVITSPAVHQATSPVTGLPIAPILGGGAVMVLAGLYLVVRKGAVH